MQQVFLLWLGLGLGLGLIFTYLPYGTQALHPLMGWVGAVFWAVTSLVMLMCTYRCAQGSGRSGVFWVLGVLMFKLVPLIALSYLTRQWLISQGVKVHSLGLSYTLPDEGPFEEDSIGISRC
jgi:hypothetical protein